MVQQSQHKHDIGVLLGGLAVDGLALRGRWLGNQSCWRDLSSPNSQKPKEPGWDLEKYKINRFNLFSMNSHDLDACGARWCGRYRGVGHAVARREIAVQTLALLGQLGGPFLLDPLLARLLEQARHGAACGERGGI